MNQTQELFTVRPSVLPGCLELLPIVRADERGWFVKVFESSAFEALGLPTSWPEHFFSKSRLGVIRGLHFQEPPHAQAKLVACVSGRVLDVVVDLRVGSPTFGHFDTFELDDETCSVVYVPVGMAHGFTALTDGTVMFYAGTMEFDPKLDAGIRWDSIGCDWPLPNPTVSRRDAALPPLRDYDSPFRFWSDDG